MPLPQKRAGAEAEVAASIAASVRRAQAHSTPFAHWWLPDVLPKDVARALTALPHTPHELGGVSGRRELHNDKRWYLAGDALRGAYPARAIARAFQGGKVVSALAALTGAVLAGAFLRIEYALDLDGFWLEPHTDLGVKLFTLLLQLAGPGQQGLGTDLYWDAQTWAERTPFIWNAALVFAPSGQSWHGFESRPIQGVRRSLIVNYVTDQWRAREQLAFPSQPVRYDAA